MSVSRAVLGAVLLAGTALPVRAGPGSVVAGWNEIETVTVRQWTEDQLETPETVELLDNQKVATPLWQDFSALRKISPNTQVQESSVENRVVIRGSTAVNTGLQDPVGYFVNGVALPLGALQAPDNFDAAGLEIAKGPQGTLYGGNSEAGALIVNTRDPDDHFTAEASVAPEFIDGPSGRWGKGVVAGGRISGPLSDRLSAAAAVHYHHNEGIYRNLYDKRKNGGAVDRYTFSGGLAYAVDDASDIELKSVVEEYNRGKARMRYISGSYATAPYTTNYNVHAWDNDLSAVQALKIRHHFDGMTLTSVTGWVRFDRKFRMDFDAGPLATPASHLRHKDDAISQEMRLESDADGRLRWLVGMYFRQQWSHLNYANKSPQVVRITGIDQTTLAGFGQLEYCLLPDLRLSLGARLERIMQNGDQRYVQSDGTSAYGKVMHHTTFLPRASLSYTLSPDVMLFASYARGYMPGGYNYSMATGKSSLTYHPEYSRTGEGGIKMRLLAQRLHIGLSGFYNLTHDRQILDLMVGGTQKISNAAKTKTYGLELTSRYLLTESWSLLATGGLMHAEATDYQAYQSVNSTRTKVDLSGNMLPMAAAFTYSLGADYNAAGAGFHGEVSLNGSGPFYFNSANTLRQKSSVLMDAGFGYRFASYDISLWGKNLSDHHSYTRMISAKVGKIAEDAAPRELGLRLTARW